MELPHLVRFHNIVQLGAVKCEENIRFFFIVVKEHCGVQKKQFSPYRAGSVSIVMVLVAVSCVDIFNSDCERFKMRSN
jgi:hypothetical protein